MKSSNPNSGIYKADTSRTLDLNGGSPACNQGGMIVLEGNGSRPSHKDDRYVKSETMYTPNSAEHHTMCVDGYNLSGNEEVSPTLTCQRVDTKNVPMVMEQAISIGNGQLHDAMSPSIEVSKTLNCMDDPMKVVCVGNGQLAQAKLSDKVGALNCMHDQQAILTYGLDRASFNQGQNAQYDFSIEEEKAQTLVAKGPGGVCTQQ